MIGWSRALRKLDEDEAGLFLQIGSVGGASQKVVEWLEKQLAGIEGKRIELTHSRHELERERDSLAAASIEARQLKKSLKVVFDRLERSSRDVQRGILRQLIESVTIYSGSRVEIRWRVPACESGGRRFGLEIEWGGKRVSAQPKCPPPETPLIIDYCVKASYKNPAILRQKYVEEKLSIEAISKQFSSSKSTIYKYLRVAGIELRREDKKNRSQLRYGEVWRDGRVTRHEREQDIAKMRELRAKGYSF